MTVLTFHSVDNTFSPGINNYRPDRFCRLINRLKDSGCRFVSIDDYLASSPSDNDIALTFDDGYASFHEHVFPFLTDLAIPAAVFIPARFIGEPARWDYHRGFGRRHLSRNQLTEIAAVNFEIGAHGHSHCDLTSLSPRRLKLELSGAKNCLEDTVGREIKYISYPFGRFNATVESYAAETGYHRGFSISSGTRSRSGFTVTGQAVYTIDTTYSVFNKIGRGPFSRLEKLKGMIINFYAGGTILLNRLRLTERIDNP